MVTTSLWTRSEIFFKIDGDTTFKSGINTNKRTKLCHFRDFDQNIPPVQLDIAGVYMTFEAIPTTNVMYRKYISSVYVGEPFYMYLRYRGGKCAY